MIRSIFKFLKRVFLTLLLLFLVVPYLLPREGTQVRESMPFEHSLTLNSSQGVMIHTRVYENKQPLVGQIMLIHGLGGSTFSYEENAPFLADLGYFVVTVDLPAFGFSSRERGLHHTQNNRAMWLWDVLNQIEVMYDLRSKWIIGGHSMGGSVALAMNNAQPMKTEALILIDPALRGGNQRGGSLLSWMVMNTPVGEWLRVFLTYGLLTPERFQSSLSSAYGVEASDEQVEAYLRPLRTQGTTQALREFFATSQSVSLEDWMHPSTPVIVLWGEEDAWIPVSELQPLLEKGENVVAFVLEGEGHNPMETNPSLFNEKLREGLNQLKLD